MSGRLRSALLVLGAALAAGALIGVVYTWRDAALTVALLLALGVPAVAAAHVARARRRRLGSPRRQIALGIAIGLGELVVVVGAGVALMFVSAHDALVIGAVTAFALVVAIRSVQLVSTGVMDDAERMRRELIAAVSHDLRTPITSLRLLTDAVADDVVDEATRRSYLRQMSTHIDALSALIDDLFELSKLEAGEIAWSLEQVRLDELVGDSVDAMQVQAAATPGRGARGAPARSADRARRPRAAPARALQPDPERDPPHAGRRLGRRPRRARGRRGRDRGGRHRGRDRGRGPRARLRARSSAAASRRRARRAGPGSGWRSRARSSRPTAGRIWLADAPAGTAVRFSLPLTS